MQTGKAISVPAILKVGNGTLNQLGSYLKGEGLKQVVIFLGNGLIDMFGETVMESLKKEEITVLEYSELDTVDIDDIITLAFSMPNKTQAVISIGGGKVIDAGKYAAFLRNIPFISVPTSSSSDGFSSASASLLVHGKRTSVPAKLAYGIVVDTQIIRTAPEKFIYSGIGDMISKITALYDWIYEEKCGYSTVNDFAVMIAKKAVNSFVRTPYQSIKDELFLKESELIKDVAKKESCVIVGRCANFVLKDRKDITTVFIYSNMEDKIKRATTFYGLNKENAKKEIKRIDKLRANHYKYYTNNNWNDCSNYDICINSDTFGVEETAELICKMVSKKETKEV